MKRFALSFALILSAGLMMAQNIAGTWTMNFPKGVQVYTDRTPVKDSFNGSTTLTITQTGDEVSATVANYASEWSTHNQSGRVGNKRLVTALTNGDRSVYLITATVVDKKTIKGTFLYLRHGDGSSGIVPGWTRVPFTATR